jgi:hypothetical protein
MTVSIPLEFPVSLGKAEKNSMDNLKSEIKFGRWANLEEDFTKPVKWEKVKAWGSIVDRSVSNIPSASSEDELGILTKYENPETGMPNYELLPLDSELFDTENMPNEDLVDTYTQATIKFKPQPTYSSKNKKERNKNNMYGLAAIIGVSMILKGDEMLSYLYSILYDRET